VFRTLIMKAVVRSAMYFEKSSWELYRKLFEKARDPAHRELFERLAREEASHIQHLGDVLGEKGPGPCADEDAIRADLEQLHIPDPVELRSGADFAEILESIISFEETTVKFYELAMARTPVRAAKEAFAYLASEEAKHVAELRRKWRDCSADR